MDGTLSELVPVPEDAEVRPSIKANLSALCHKLPLVAVITGRSSAQASEIVGVPDLTYVGNHGLERLQDGRMVFHEDVIPYLSYLTQTREGLQERFTAPGITFEDKGASFAVHYRQVDNPDQVRDDLLAALHQVAENKVRLMSGKQVINILPPVTHDKGTAVTWLVKQHNLSRALVMGDDITDLDLFRAARRLSDQGQLECLCVGVVGANSPPALENAVDFTLRSVSDVDEFLGLLTERLT